MKKEEKNQLVDSLTKELSSSSNFYLTDISELNVETINNIRRLCFNRDIKLKVVKNTLLKKAMVNVENDYSSLLDLLKGPTSIMFCNTASAPAKLIKELRRTSPKPILKGAYIESCCYVGDDQIESLASLKSKNELIGDIIGLLQSPAKNVISALNSGRDTLAGVVKTLSEK